jgi:prepilin-type processing-associated H-X9-DG protein
MPYPHSRESRRDVTCRNNLKQIGLALWAYEQRYGSLPPAYVADTNGKPLHSWRTLILPFMDETAVYRTIDLDKAWDDPANSKTFRQGAIIYACPLEWNDTTQTSYLAVVGPNTAWPGATGRKFSEFKDPSSTILVVEVVNSGIQWSEPRDLYVGQMAPGINAGGTNLGMSSWHGPYANAVFADGSVHTLPNELDPKTLKALLDINNPPDISVVDQY